MDWREEYRRRLTSPEEAVRAVHPGDRVVIPIGHNPQALGDALATRLDELEGVEVAHTAVGWPYVWLEPGVETPFRIVHEHWASPLGSPGLRSRQHDYLPIPFSLRFKGAQAHRTPEEARPPDVVMVQVTPPDEHGQVNLGPHVWNVREYIARARVVLAEVSRSLPHCHGHTRLPVTAFTHFVEYDSPPLSARHLRPDPVVQAIAEQVADLVRDGDTLQIGGGSVSFGIAYSGVLARKNDLGWHSEITPSPIVRLVREGVITGRHKTVDRGLAVSCGIVGDPEDWAYLDQNPAFEVRGCSYVLDPQVIARQENFVAINGALLVDLTGQIAAESLGPTMMTGTGGLLEVVIGALWSRGGRSITVLPSTGLEGKASRIVPLLPEGTVVSVPRLLADIVVTEYGVARLMGKTMRERAEALIAIAHPDFRQELRDHARRLFYP